MESITLHTEIKNLITVDQAWYYKIIPLSLNQNTLELLIAKDSINQSIATELEVITGYKIHLQETETSIIESHLFKHYPKSSGSHQNNLLADDNFKLNIQSDSFINTLVKEAKSLGSSDIHIEIYDEKCRIRFRIDGVLVDRHKLNKSEYPTVINKIKISASCDIAEKRLPQDGRIRLQVNNSKVEIRVSILPTLYGEKIVLRILGSDANHLDLEKLGFTNDEKNYFKNAIQKTHGIILISGPTGSGKTTTLYATLKELNKPTLNISTIEDPIEYTLDGVNQVQLKEDIGLNYTEALRSFLRQDPDIIMLGEIRDAQTAQMAIRAALTGHLVLSTIHTNSAWGTISRLIDMGIPAYLLSGTLNLSVAQRLVRTLCPSCKTINPLDAHELPEQFRNYNLKEHYIAKGCNSCYHTGYKGRKAIYEVIPITKELSEHIKSNTTQIDEYCKRHHINKLSENAFSLLMNGETSLEEIYPYLLNEN